MRLWLLTNGVSIPEMKNFECDELSCEGEFRILRLVKKVWWVGGAGCRRRRGKPPGGQGLFGAPTGRGALVQSLGPTGLFHRATSILFSNGVVYISRSPRPRKGNVDSQKGRAIVCVSRVALWGEGRLFQGVVGEHGATAPMDHREISSSSTPAAHQGVAALGLLLPASGLLRPRTLATAQL